MFHRIFRGTNTTYDHSPIENVGETDVVSLRDGVQGGARNQALELETDHQSVGISPIRSTVRLSTTLSAFTCVDGIP